MAFSRYEFAQDLDLRFSALYLAWHENYPGLADHCCGAVLSQVEHLMAYESLRST